MNLAAFQHAFWQDLWSATPSAEHAWATQPGFAVYRNTVLKGCVDNLLALYPAVRHLTGDDWLQAVALDYARAHPPADGRLHAYGEHFPAAIAHALRPGELPWLHEVAQLDQLWMASHLAADAPCLTPQDLATLAPDTLATTRLHLHPTAHWHHSAAWPVFHLWQAAREAHADPNPPHWLAEGALFTRPHGAVQATLLTATAHTLLTACAAGLTLLEALATTQANHPEADLGHTLAALVTQGAFTAIEP